MTSFLEGLSVVFVVFGVRHQSVKDWIHMTPGHIFDIFGV